MLDRLEVVTVELVKLLYDALEHLDVGAGEDALVRNVRLQVLLELLAVSLALTLKLGSALLDCVEEFSCFLGFHSDALFKLRLGVLIPRRHRALSLRST